MNAHTAVGIALVVVYIPVTVLALPLGIRCWRYGSKMACYMIMIFTMIRLASGALVILVERNLSASNATLIKVTYILVNLGVVPLLASYDGFLSLISRENFPHNAVLRNIHRLCALAILLATGLLIGAGTMTGKTDQANLQSILYKVGYFDFLAVFVVAVLLSIRVYLFQRQKVTDPHLTIVKWLVLSAPFLALRTAYGIIGILEATGDNMFSSQWSSLFGNATILALMALLPECIVICIYLHILRFRIRTGRNAKRLVDGEGALIREGAGRELDDRRSRHRKAHSSRYHQRR